MKFKKLISFCAFLVLTSSLFAQGTKYHLLIGTYTSPGKSEGIYVYEFDTQNAALTYKTKAVIGSPSYFALTKDRKHLYTVGEDQGSKISAFAYDSKTGDLKFLNTVASGSKGPTYISLDANDKYVFAANYGGGSLTAAPINPDGTLGEDTQDIKHEGSVSHPRPHVHSAVLTPDNKYVMAADLGTDKVNIYKFDAKKRPNALSPAEQPFLSLNDQTGPRHSTFHPNGKFYYVVGEFDGSITAFSYKKGKFNKIQSSTMKPEGYVGKADGADIHVSADGKFLYASTRNVLNEIVTFSVDQNTGMLTFVGKTSTLGKSSRTFDIDPSGNWMLVTNQATGNIVVFKRDQVTGLVTPTGEQLQIDKPSFVKFVPID
jgi:6-phosphogluconolactonase